MLLFTDATFHKKVICVPLTNIPPSKEKNIYKKILLKIGFGGMRNVREIQGNR